MFNHARHIVTITMLVLALTFAGLFGAAMPSAVAGPEDGDITIVSPTEGATVVRNTPTDIELDIAPGLDPGSYMLWFYRSTSPTSYGQQYFSIDGADIAAGHATVPGVLFPYVGDVRIDVHRSGAYRQFDRLTVSVVDPPPPSVMITPGYGSKLPPGFTGPVTVRLINGTAGSYELNIRRRDYNQYDPDDYNLVKSFNHDGSSDHTYSFTVPQMTIPGAYSIWVEGPDGQQIEGWVEVNVFETIDLGEDQDPVEFWPIVRDGVRDTAAIVFDVNVPAQLQVRVLNADDRVVRSEELGNLQPGVRSWEWDGRNDAGQTVRPGSYTLQVNAVDGNGYSDSLTRGAEVVTKVVTMTRNKRERGVETTSRSRAGNCHFNGYSGSLRLDCWGGRYAQATWTFRVPKSTTHFNLAIRGTVGCCETGRVIRRKERVSPTVVRALVRVTEWRAYTVDSVRLAYRYQVRR